MTNEPGLRNVGLRGRPPGGHRRLAAVGYGLVGGTGQYEQIWRMAYVRGPTGYRVAG
jgi:hypothetical protein